MSALARELHGIPLPDLVGYLTSLGGQAQATEPGQPIVVAGPGWQAAITRLPDYRLGQASFCSYKVEFQGEESAVQPVWAGFHQRIMRPGG